MITSYKSKIYYLLKNNSNLLSDGIALDISKKTCNFKHDKLKIFRILKVLNLLENKVLASQESFKGLNSTVMGKNTFISFTQIIYNGINPNIFFLKKYS